MKQRSFMFALFLFGFHFVLFQEERCELNSSKKTFKGLLICPAIGGARFTSAGNKKKMKLFDGPGSNVSLQMKYR